jgi:hypothetical protein
MRKILLAAVLSLSVPGPALAGQQAGRTTDHDCYEYGDCSGRDEYGDGRGGYSGGPSGGYYEGGQGGSDYDGDGDGNRCRNFCVYPVQPPS